jgi:hypothetical protein
MDLLVCVLLLCGRFEIQFANVVPGLKPHGRPYLAKIGEVWPRLLIIPGMKLELAELILGEPDVVASTSFSALRVYSRARVSIHYQDRVVVTVQPFRARAHPPNAPNQNDAYINVG